MNNAYIIMELTTQVTYIALDKVLLFSFQSKCIDTFLISPPKHVVVIH